MAERWRMSSHARHRMVDMGLDRWDVIQVLKSPTLDYPSNPTRFGVGRRVAVGKGIAVVYRGRLVLTVLYDRPEHWISRPKTPDRALSQPAGTR